MSRGLTVALLLWSLLAQPAAAAEHRYFTTSDGVKLHYIEEGAGRPRTIVFVPGWTMPAWIWDRQIAHFGRTHHVIAFDPRSQGASQIAHAGHEPVRRGRDIAELIEHLGRERVLLVGWSLGVLDSLAYVRGAGEGRLAGLVLVDNSIGEDPPPVPTPPSKGAKPLREVAMASFVRGMFATPQPEPWLDRLIRSALRTPEPAANALLAYPVPRTWWKEAVYAVSRPVLYLVRPKFEGQAANLAARHPTAETLVLRGPGHALFIDDPARFHAALDDFARRRVWQ